MNEAEQRRLDHIRRVKADIAHDEEASRAAAEQRDVLEVKRLTRDLENRRAYLAELLGQQAPEP